MAARRPMTRWQSAQVLNEMGWRTDTTARLTQAIKDFQGMWNLGSKLSVDGIIGPKTSAALELSAARRKARKGDISANFSAREFMCKCGGRFYGCRRIWTSRATVQLAERIRKAKGPWSPVSGCRCDGHNRYVGGATRSQHKSGLAMDVPAKLNLTIAQAQGVKARGIGYGGRSRKVLHVDLGSTRSWVYSNS